MTVLVLTLLTAWAAAALYFDLPVAGLRLPAALLYALVTISALALLKERWVVMGLAAAGFVLVLAWWRTLRPSNNRQWQPDVARRSWAEIDGDRVTIHNLRNCDYRTETDYLPHWETRTVNLSHLRGVDIFLTYWGSPWIAHPIVSFDFGDGNHIAISIETRKQVGESYSTFRGFFRQYQLIYIISDERDVVRLRSNYRTGEDVYLFRTNAALQLARALFLEYLARINRIRKHPEWYNALTNNCTTNISVLAASAQGIRPRWDWRILCNGRAGQMLYERGELAGDLPYAELKAKAYINPAAKAADRDPDFSRRIRAGRPGFTPE
ncbi:MAG: DUF4105 domain-containing protein [Candidatus Korobacteraceae bacterium]